jgi:hypothetical protein
MYDSMSPSIISWLCLGMINLSGRQATLKNILGPFEKFVNWWQCTAVMQRKAVTVMPSCSGGGNVAVA